MNSIVIVIVISQVIQWLSIVLFFYQISKRVSRIEKVLTDILNVLEGSKFPEFINGGNEVSNAKQEQKIKL